MKIVYKITFPNGKIYVGQDRTDRIIYFGSADRSLNRTRLHAGTAAWLYLRREILRESETATNAEVTAREFAFIAELRSNDPAVGYNRRPKFRPVVPPGINH